MADASAPETKSVTFRISVTRTPQVKITYKDKNDLFEAFKKKMAELGVPLDKLYSVNAESEPIRMNNADSVLEAAENYCGGYKLYVLDDADEEESSSGCDEFADHHWTDHNIGGRPRPYNRSGAHRRFYGRRQHCGRWCFDGY